MEVLLLSMQSIMKWKYETREKYAHRTRDADKRAYEECLDRYIYIDGWMDVWMDEWRRQKVTRLKLLCILLTRYNNVTMMTLIFASMSMSL